MEGVLNIYQYLSATRPKTFGVLTLIGVLIVLSKVLKYLRAFYKVALRPRKNLIKRYGENTWVLVTGSSDGNVQAMQVLASSSLYLLPRGDSTSFLLPELNPNSRK